MRRVRLRGGASFALLPITMTQISRSRSAAELNDVGTKIGGAVELSEQAAKGVAKSSLIKDLAPAAQKAAGGATKLAKGGLSAFGAVTGAIDGYEKSTAKSTAGKVAHGLAVGAGEGLVGATPGLGLIDGSLALAGAENLRPAKLVRGTVDGAAAVGGAITGNESALVDYQRNTLKGEYGYVLQGAATIGDGIAGLADSVVRGLRGRIRG